MNLLLELVEPFYSWLFFLVLMFIFNKLFLWAKNKKTGALVFGILTQMFMPDPYVERTVQVVQEDKKESKQAEDDSGDPKLD